MKHNSIYRFLFLGLLAVTLTACGGGGGGGGGVVTPPVCIDGSGVSVFWTANREAAVNTAGGGYKVYYSQSSGFAIGDGGVSSQVVPYVSGTTAPSCTEINLASGTWYVRVTATSTLDAPGTTGGSESVASAQTTVVVP